MSVSLSQVRPSVSSTTAYLDILAIPGAHQRSHQTQMLHLFIFQTCSFLNGASVEWIEDQKVPYAVKGDQWVGFENDRSIDAKVRCRVVEYFSASPGLSNVTFVLCEWLTGGLFEEEAAGRGFRVDSGYG